MNNRLKVLLNILNPFIDPVRFLRSCGALSAFIGDIYRYRRLPGAEPLRVRDLQPVLDQNTKTTAFDVHYVYLGEWALRQIVKSGVKEHVDVGSQISWVTCLSCVVHVIFIDIWPFPGSVEGLESCAGSILQLPFRDRAVGSISCLHVVEHIGLGRYGDPLDPLGTRKAIRELSRVLAEGGKLYLGLPVGRPRICFNGHRIHDPEDIVEWFAEEGVVLESFSVVDDEGQCHHSVRPADYKDSRYVCGMYCMTKAPFR